MFHPLFMCFSPYLGVGGGGAPKGAGHNLLMQFSSLASSKMVVPLPSSRCFAEGNRIFWSIHRDYKKLDSTCLVTLYLNDDSHV